MTSAHVGARRASFTFDSSARGHNVCSTTLRSIHTHLPPIFSARWLLIAIAFITGFALTAIMKWEHIIWLAASTAGASPLLQFGQGSTFDYPGLRFGADKKFSITVFSDLHLGERESSPSSDLAVELTASSIMDRTGERAPG